MALILKLLIFCVAVVLTIAAAIGIAVLVSITRGRRIILDPRKYEYRYDNGEWILVKRYGEGEKRHVGKIRGKLRKREIPEDHDEPKGH